MNTNEKHTEHMAASHPTLSLSHGREQSASKPTPKQDDYFRCPDDTGVFDVTGTCLEPVIRDGQKVFVYPHDGGEIRRDTPVAIVLKSGKRMVKLWRGIEGEYIALRYLNGSNGGPGTLFIPAGDLSEIWIVGGLWFNGVPLSIERPMGALPLLTHERLVATIHRKAPAGTHATPAPKPSPASKKKATGKKSSAKRSA